MLLTFENKPFSFRPIAKGPLACALAVIVPTSQTIENLPGFRANPDVKMPPVRFHVVNLLRGRIGPMLLIYYVHSRFGPAQMIRPGKAEQRKRGHYRAQ